MHFLFSGKSIFNVLIVFSFLCYPSKTQSQIVFENYIEVLNNNVSRGVNTNFATQLAARVGNFSISSAGLFTFQDPQKNTLKAFTIHSAIHFKLLKKDFFVEPFYLWKPFSDILRETNYGIITDLQTKHVGLGIGFNSRNYSFSEASYQRYNFDKDTKTNIRETINMMYKISFYQTIYKKLDLGLSISNYDLFIIQQATNPMLTAKFSYNVNSNLKVFSDVGVIEAGILNLRVNHFGLFWKGGLQWQIK